MDMFKLLTRSTTLQKSADRKAPHQQLPSAGETHRGTVDEAQKEPVRLHSETIRGTKRKRTLTAQGQANGILRPSNSFGNGPANETIETAATEPNVREAEENNTSAQDAQVFEENASLRSEEDCKRLLKKHKLKITILDCGETVRAKHETHNTSSETAGSGRKKDVHSQLLPQPLTEFKELQTKYRVSRRLAQNLDAQAYRVPTEVQMASLPLLLGSDDDRGLRRGQKKRKKNERSRVDLLTVAPTGSGKTLAFMIPTLQRLLQQRRVENSNKAKQLARGVQTLVLAPTHELVDQIVNDGRKLVVGAGITIAAMKKGMRLHPELQGVEKQEGGTQVFLNDQHVKEQGLKRGSLVKTDVLVSTPLMLLHAISDSSDHPPLPLLLVQHIVFDEADILLDPLFREQTLRIWKACTNPSLQVSLWSATIGSSIESLAQSFIINRRRELGLCESSSPPHYIIRIVVGLKDSAIPNISHRLVYAASEQGKLLALRQLLHPSVSSSASSTSLQPPFIIFTQTIPRAVALHSELLFDISPEAGGSSRIAVIHSDLSDTARSNIMAGFRQGEIWILITTDLLSRGVDFRGINGVVNYDIPTTGASYVHRAGRTGRQGREGGVAVTLYTKEDIPYVKNVANVIAARRDVSSEGGKRGSEAGAEGVQNWLLDALPNVSKKTKKELKSKGVESRRVGAGVEVGHGASKMRISTKSGYDRRLENLKKGAVRGSQQRLAREQAVERVSGDDSAWEGCDH